MKRPLAALALCAAPLLALPLTALLAPPAEAQVTVYDPANHAQNILQAVRALQELEGQLQQLAHEIEMLENMARNLETLPVSVAESIIGQRIIRIEEVLRRARGIGYSVDSIERDYQAAYPEAYGPATSRQVLVDDARARWRQSLSAFQDTLAVSAAALEDNATDAAAVGQLLALSQDAAGSLQAAQAGNELTALTAQQLMQIEAMLAAQHRAVALEEARRLAEAERGRARLSSFLGAGG
ncbi:P-type conjugative transfer protein TrbJ [Hyphomonas sp. CACIAM 19H1]|uniref:P-type conjugative transfer protein TrbJ n=1 Tax=Hyphomonas sp. CACIAM 19H1 TaxID=1873716 RepID=UPI000DED8EBA|nr:P-type conjugative transfer protein TrbJ [Hyphomonas sp. CACIAM 19H1]AXE63583.1 P-type conjugative transfer protein TrbJ [Hyphomonas sp. CACIAM 19H1]